MILDPISSKQLWIISLPLPPFQNSSNITRDYTEGRGPWVITTPPRAEGRGPRDILSSLPRAEGRGPWYIPPPPRAEEREPWDIPPPPKSRGEGISILSPSLLNTLYESLYIIRKLTLCWLTTGLSNVLLDKFFTAIIMIK